MHFNQNDIKNLERVKRLNLINSITGIKPANLIGTISSKQETNLAIFSSVMHLGSDPALLGFILRPAQDVPRHTFENIMVYNYMVKRIHPFINYCSASHFNFFLYMSFLKKVTISGFLSVLSILIFSVFFNKDYFYSRINFY